MRSLLLNSAGEFEFVPAPIFEPASRPRSEARQRAMVSNDADAVVDKERDFRAAMEQFALEQSGEAGDAMRAEQIKRKRANARNARQMGAIERRRRVGGGQQLQNVDFNPDRVPEGTNYITPQGINLSAEEFAALPPAIQQEVIAQRGDIGDAFRREPLPTTIGRLNKAHLKGNDRRPEQGEMGVLNLGNVPLRAEQARDVSMGGFLAPGGGPEGLFVDAASGTPVETASLLVERAPTRKVNSIDASAMQWVANHLENPFKPDDGIQFASGTIRDKDDPNVVIDLFDNVSTSSQSMGPQLGSGELDISGSLKPVEDAFARKGVVIPGGIRSMADLQAAADAVVAQRDKQVERVGRNNRKLVRKNVDKQLIPGAANVEEVLNDVLKVRGQNAINAARALFSIEAARVQAGDEGASARFVEEFDELRRAGSK